MRNPDHQSHPWRAVSIAVGEAPCAPVRSLLGKRFLVSQAPRLPLLECPWADDCDCQFRHHDDRRSGTGVERRTGARSATDVPSGT